MHPHCPVCYDELHDELDEGLDGAPVSLSCGHVLCTSCFEQVLNIPKICPFKCAGVSRMGTELKLTSRNIDLAYLEAAILRREAGLKASIKSYDERAATLSEECHDLGQKLRVQQQRIETHRANLEKVHAHTKRAEEETLALLLQYRDQTMREDGVGYQERLNNFDLKRCRSPKHREDDISDRVHSPKRVRGDVLANTENRNMEFTDQCT